MSLIPWPPHPLGESSGAGAGLDIPGKYGCLEPRSSSPCSHSRTDWASLAVPSGVFVEIYYICHKLCKACKSSIHLNHGPSFPVFCWQVPHHILLKPIAFVAIGFVCSDGISICNDTQHLILLYFQQRCCDSSVSIVTRLQDEQSRYCGLIPNRDMRFFCSPECPDQLWHCSPLVKWLWHQAHHSPPSDSKICKCIGMTLPFL